MSKEENKNKESSPRRKTKPKLLLKSMINFKIPPATSRNTPFCKETFFDNTICPTFEKSFRKMGFENLKSIPSTPNLKSFSSAANLFDSFTKKDAQDIPQPVLVPDKDNTLLKTFYMKQLNSAPKYPELSKAVNSLTFLFKEIGRKPLAENIFKKYNIYAKEDKAKCVTIIWTLNSEITNLIN